MRVHRFIALTCLALSGALASLGGTEAQSLETASETIAEKGRSISVFAAASVLQEAAAPVGTIEIVTDGGTRIFQVLAGPMSEGFATGYNESPVGESMVFGISIHGREEGTGAEMMVQTGVYQQSMDQVCDPFSNNIEFFPRGERSSRKRLRPGGSSPTTCPENTVDISVTEASFTEAAGALHVAGTFSGPLGRAEDAIQVSEGRFEATLHSFSGTIHQ